MGFRDRLKRVINVFQNRDPTPRDSGPGYSLRPDRPRIISGSEKTLINSVINRIAMDAAAIDIRHVLLDRHNSLQEEIPSGLNRCLNIEANMDQTGRAFIQDLVVTMLDDGVAAVVPTNWETNICKQDPDAIDITSLRVGKIKTWYPKDLDVLIYNEDTGLKEVIRVPKTRTAVLENPLFPVMNEPNSTMRRLVRKLAILDAIDEQTGSGKLNMIVQLPYTVKGDLKRQQASDRLNDIEMQLVGSKYGIAYADATEKITQLNRPLDNNLMAQIEYLTDQFYGQLGFTKEIMNGTADDHIMINYNNRTLEPIMTTIVDEFRRKFLSKKSIDHFESVMFFKDPFKLVPVSEVAKIADTFTRNEIMSSNEIRQVIGMNPSKDPAADELRNKNLNMSEEQLKAKNGDLPVNDKLNKEAKGQNGNI